MITSCIAIIFGFRFFGRGLHEISGEEMAIIAFFMLFLFVPCLWLQTDRISWWRYILP